MFLILFNGKIAKMDSKFTFAEAVAIEENKIFKVGSNDEILKLKTKNCQLVDLKGKVLLPGFIDSHMHLLSYANSQRMISFTECRSIEQIVEKAKRHLNSGKIKGKWIEGRGWNQDKFPDKQIFTKFDLDKISIEVPICFTRACGHILVVNSKALKISGIDGNTQQPAGGCIEMEENGEPSGVFSENAMELIYKKIPVPDKNEIKNMIVSGGNDALKEGLTSIHTDDFDALTGVNFQTIIDIYKELEENGELPIRIYEQCLFFSLKQFKRFLNKGYKTGNGSLFFKIGPLKLLADGSLGGRTAFLSQPYDDDPLTSGIPIFNQHELDDLVLAAHNNGMQIAVHCIGDEIMKMTLNSIAKAVDQNPRENHRHGIVHAQITDEVLVKDLKKQDVLAYIQPIFLDSDLHIVESRIGKERAKTTYNYKTMIDFKIHVSFGSDCPVEPFNVFKGIYCAVTRKDLTGLPEKGWLPEQKISVKNALYAFTKEGAYASFEEKIKGSIEEGMLADLIVIDRDIFTVPHDMIKNIKVEMTFVGGKLKYEKSKSLLK